MIIATADWHLGKRQYGLLRREEDFYKSAINLVKTCSSEERSLILNAGDIFDSNRPKVDAVFKLKEINSILVNKQCIMYYIEGNHDKTNPHWSDVVINDNDVFGIKLLKDGEFIYDEFNKINIVGFSEQPKASLIDKLSNINKEKIINSYINVLMLHASCEEFTGVAFGENSINITNDLPNIELFDYVIIGDTHITDVKNIRSSKVISPGPIEITGRGDKDLNKSYIKLIDKNNYEKCRLKTRTCIYRSILDQDHLNEVINDLIKYKDSNPLIYINYNKDISGVISRVSSLFDLSKSIIRFKPITNKSNIALNINNIDTSEENNGELISVTEFINNNKVLNNVSSDDVKDLIIKLSYSDILDGGINNDNINVKDIIETYINQKLN